jgi:molybdenum cofactor cytidylyltransferase
MKRGVSAILLAAGESRRMGAVNKLTLEIDGVPLLRRTALALLGANLVETLVVVGHQREVARALLQGLALRLVTNRHFAEGQMTSVYCGMKALQAPCAGVLVCLADQPLLETADIDRLVRAFLDDCPHPILVPTYQGRRGNPVVLAECRRQHIVAGDRDLGGKRPIDQNPDLVWPYPMENDHCVFDLDTPGDYARLLARLGNQQSRPSLETLREQPL